MQNIIIKLTIVFLLSLLVTPLAQGASVSAQELFSNSAKYDGKIVTFKGEVIGDVMTRGAHAWINVRDESGAIGVFCPKELVVEIEYTGDYNFVGDTVSLRGTFNRFCAQHGGDSDIHAERIIIVEKGRPITRPLDEQKLKAGIILSALAVLLIFVNFIVGKFR